MNKDQQKAIDTPLGENVLISAGAGSGKTSTLTEKVYHLIESGDIKPSNLLVLTFTNKAGFEMKERIIKKFKKANSSFADEILSSHIQTFDSYSLYLVNRYANALKVSPNLNIIPQEINDEKTQEIITNVLNEYYENEDPRMKELANLYFFKDDSYLKKIIIAFIDKLSTLSPSLKKDIEDNYSTKYLSNNFINEIIDQLITNSQQEFKEFSEKYYDFRRNGFLNDYTSVIERFNSDGITKRFNTKSGELSLINSKALEFLKELYEENESVAPSMVSDTEGKMEACYPYFDDLFKRGLACNKKEYVEFCNSIDFVDANGKKLTTPRTNDTSKIIFSWIRLNILKCISDISYLKDINDQKDILLQYKKRIDFIIEIVKKVEERMFEFKRRVNSFTFSDVSSMALSLLVDEQYKDIADEIRSSIKYVLVDEYQDTNNQQETFINEISKNCTLFVVGDVKQSIYLFRHADCSLILNRKEKYTKNESGHEEAIEMNINYRSVKKIIEGINKLFCAVLTPSTGGIDYKKSENLEYDEKIDLYNESKLYSKGEYGVNVLFKGYAPYTCAPNDGTSQEAMIIIADILKKIREKYQVLDRDSHKLRDCEFRDFAILVGRQTNTHCYIKLFDQFRIPLNYNVDESLYDLDCIMVISSLINYINGKVNNVDVNYRHLYLSLARSFLFEINDEVLYETVLDEEKLDNNPVFGKIDSFIKDNLSLPFSVIFSNMLQFFNIFEHLEKIGNVTLNISKLESLKQTIDTFEGTGQGLKDFCVFFEGIKKYRIEPQTANSYDEDNSVELTTIHKSKGLEYSIVYLPLGQCFGRRTDRDSVPFSIKYGFSISTPKVGEMYKTFLDPLIRGDNTKAACEEAYRVMYVACTRPKESLYFVSYGDPFTYENIEKTLPNNLIINEDVFRILSKHFNIVEHFSVLKKIVEKRNRYLSEVLTEEKNPDIVSFKECYVRLVNSIVPIVFKALANDYYNYVIYPNVSKISEATSLKKEDCQFLPHSYFNLSTYGESKKFPLQIDDDHTPFMAYQSRDKAVDEYYLNNPKKFADLIYSCFVNPRSKDKLDMLLSLFEGFDGYLYYFDYADFKTYDAATNSSQNFVPLASQSLSEISKLRIENTLINSNKVIGSKASHEVKDDDQKDYLEAALKRGTHLHYLLELVDFTSKDTSFILDKDDRSLIDKVLSLSIFKDIESYTVFKEYEYIDSNDIKGSIDLLLVGNNDIKIIDYKTSNIDDPAYIRQVSIYKENISRLFNTNNIKTYLLSIQKGIFKEI